MTSHLTNATPLRECGRFFRARGSGIPGLTDLVTVFGLVVALAISPLCAAQDPPNIVILFADDLGYGDLGSYGSPYIRTPNLDRLAAQGQRWTDFYAVAPVCSPSRGALLTGKYPVRTGLYGREVPVMFSGDPNGVPPDEITLAEALKSAGYATGMFGKWHLGDAPEHYPTRHGFDYWFGTPLSNDMNATDRIPIEEVYQLRIAGEFEEIQRNIRGFIAKFDNPRSEDFDVHSVRSERTEGGYRDENLERPIYQPTFTRDLTEEAIAFIEQNRDGPFLVYLPYAMPHLPIFASEDFAGTSLGGPYGDTIEEIDWSVGQVVAALERLGLVESTLVLFTSDNGPWQGVHTHFAGSAGPLRDSKGSVYEGGMRVPAIFHLPGRIEPAVVSDIGTTMDVYATALSLAGQDLPDDIDGFDMTETLMSGAPSPRRELAYYSAGQLRAYRKGDFKIHFYDSRAATEPLAVPELYDLSRDVSERDNLAARRPDVLADLMESVEAHRRQTPVAEPIFDRRFAKYRSEH